MSVMTQLAESIQLRGVAVPENVDLPLPNIYFASINPYGLQPLSVYVSADFISAGIRKVANWCTHHHRFRPMKSNSVIRLRRLRMKDVVENPAAYEAAIRLAQFNGEADIVAGLEKWPEWIAARLNVPMPKTIDVSDVWSRLQSAVEEQDRRSHAEAHIRR